MVESSADSQSARGLAQSKSWRTFRAPRYFAERRGLGLSSGAFFLAVRTSQGWLPLYPVRSLRASSLNGGIFLEFRLLAERLPTVPMSQLEFSLEAPPKREGIFEELTQFQQFGRKTFVENSVCPIFQNEFWTSRQRAAHSLHEISYRACFKPQLPRFFIERFTRPGEVVYDPFMGRGTTLLEAALLERKVAGCDINPLSIALIRPRLNPPQLPEVMARLNKLNWNAPGEPPSELLVFYHPETLRQIWSLRSYLLERGDKCDRVDEWIRLVALNRLTGHSRGFFSVYTMPPNQAVSIQSQRKINERRGQTPPSRDVAKIILKKSSALLAHVQPAERARLETSAKTALFITSEACNTPSLASESVALVVTSPPFLDVVDYATDNWLRCWFLNIDPQQIQITKSSKLEKWQQEMTNVFRELRRVLKIGGHIAFEVGEVRSGEIKLEETVLKCGQEAGLKPEFILINSQVFTKTANCWGVENNSKGTNSNRVVVFRKE